MGQWTSAFNIPSFTLIRKSSDSPHCSPFNTFPNEVLTEIVKHMHPDELCVCSLVNRHWRDLCSAPGLWLGLIERDWKVTTINQRQAIVNEIDANRTTPIHPKIIYFWLRKKNKKHGPIFEVEFPQQQLRYFITEPTLLASIVGLVATPIVSLLCGHFERYFSWQTSLKTVLVTTVMGVIVTYYYWDVYKDKERNKPLEEEYRSGAACVSLLIGSKLLFSTIPDSFIYDHHLPFVFLLLPTLWTLGNSYWLWKVIPQTLVTNRVSEI